MQQHTWTAKRLDNVIRVRKYTEEYHYEGDDGMTDWVRMTSETVIAARDLGQFMIDNSIDEFGGEDDMEIQSKIFP